MTITAGVLDDFNRTENPLSQGGAWGPGVTGDGDLQTTGTECGAAVASASAYRTATTSANCSAWATISVKGSDGSHAYLWVCVQAPNTAGQDDYTLVISFDAGGDFLQLYRGDDLSGTQLGADIAHEITAGESIGLKRNGNDLEVYSDTGSGWTLLATRTDSTYGAGVIGLGLHDPSAPQEIRFDEFGGGDEAAPATKKPFYHHQLMRRAA